MATLKVSRLRQRYQGVLVRMVVLLDGRRIGALWGGATKTFDIPAGTHRLRIRAALKHSNEIEFDISDDTCAAFICDVRGTPIESVVASFTDRDNFLVLWPAEASPG